MWDRCLPIFLVSLQSRAVVRTAVPEHHLTDGPSETKLARLGSEAEALQDGSRNH